MLLYCLLIKNIRLFKTYSYLTRDFLYIAEVQAAGSTYGKYFRVTTYGESHGGGVGCVVDGCPPQLPLCEEDLQKDLDRRYLTWRFSGLISKFLC